MGLITVIVNYNDSRNLMGAIDYIEENRSKLRVPELNSALEWAGKDYKQYKGKDAKIRELLQYLRYEYIK